MPTSSLVQQPDPEMEQLQAASLYSKMLREGAQKNIDANKNGRMVGPYWIADNDTGEHLKQATSAGLDFFGGREKAALETKRLGEEKDWMDRAANLPTTRDAYTPGGIRPEDPNNPDEAGMGAYQAPDVKTSLPLTYAERMAQAQQLAGSAPQYSTLAQAYKAQLLKHTIPEAPKAAEPYTLSQGQERRGINNEMVASGPAKTFAPPVPRAPRSWQTTGDDGTVRTHDEMPDGTIRTRDVGKYGKTKTQSQPPLMVVQTTDKNGNPVTQVLPKTVGTVVPGAPTSAERTNKREKTELAGDVNEALRLAKANPDAFGFKTVVPAWLLNRLDKPGVDARIEVAKLSSAQIKDMSGTAVSAHEQKRLNGFLPEPLDDAESVIKKLARYARELERKGYTVGGTAGTPPHAATAFDASQFSVEAEEE